MASAIGPKPTAVAPKPSIEIRLERHFSSKIYTSGSTISGHAVVNSPRDLSFDNFEIVFTGVAFTRLDFVQQYPTQSHKPFLKLRMPLSDADFPESRVFEAGRSYDVPFNFVVPHQLPEGSCAHSPAVSPALREHHLRLPPSMGCWDADDQAPDMAHVEYSVKARAFAKSGSPVARQVKVADGSKILKVLPSLPEDAPLDITSRDERYKLDKSKTIRKGLFSPKTAKLTASASQPGAAMLAADGHGCSGTTARVHLDYAPESTDSAPPKINSVSAKLQALTFFSAAPADDMPNLGSRGSYSTSHSLSYSTTTTLPSAAVDKVRWGQEPVPLPRRDSGYESSHMDDLCGSDSDASADNNGRGRRGSKSKSKIGGNKPHAPFKYTSTLEVPISIPCSNKKFFLPTFHSCLISRTYTLQLTLSAGPTNTTITLNLPLQVGVETIYEPQGSDELPSFESVMAMDGGGEDPDAYLRPRVIQVPPPQMQMTSMLPAYGSTRQAIGVA